MDKKKAEIMLGVNMATDFEGFEEYPYTCPAGYLTIGIGRNLDVYPYTREEAITWTAKILEERRKELIIHHPWLVEMPVEIRLIVTDMAYNMGTQGTLGFKKMFKAMKAGDFTLAAEELKDSKYYKDTGNRADTHYRVLKEL